METDVTFFFQWMTKMKEEFEWKKVKNFKSDIIVELIPLKANNKKIII